MAGRRIWRIVLDWRSSRPYCPCGRL